MPLPPDIYQQILHSLQNLHVEIKNVTPPHEPSLKSILTQAMPSVYAVIVSGSLNALVLLRTAKMNNKNLKYLKEYETKFKVDQNLKNKKSESLELIFQALVDTKAAQDKKIAILYQQNKGLQGFVEDDYTTSLKVRHLEEDYKISEAKAKMNLGITRFKFYFDYPEIDAHVGELIEIFRRLRATYELINQGGSMSVAQIFNDADRLFLKIKQHI